MDSSLALHPCFQRRRGNHGAEKAKILATTKKEGLTGAQVSTRFGIAMLTFYKVGGPVRSDALKRRGKRSPGRPAGTVRPA